MLVIGGYRENSGRKDAFGGKDASPVPMALTPNGERILTATCERTGLTRNDVLTHLTLKHAKSLKFREEGIVYPGKDRDAVRSIRVTAKARKLLVAARDRTGKSFSDLGEAMLVKFADRTKDFPAPYERKARRRTHAR